MTALTSRRGLLTVLAAAPVAASTTGIAGAGGPPSAFRIAEARVRAAEALFDHLPVNPDLDDPTVRRRAEDLLHAALNELDHAPIVDWNEFSDALEESYDRGALGSDGQTVKLVAACRRLAGQMSSRRRSGKPLARPRRIIF